MITNIEESGFRKAPTHAEKVHEAASLFGKGRNGSNYSAQALLMEAFTTSDFPKLLGNAFEQKAVAAQQAAVREFEPVLSAATLPDFRRSKLVDLWSGDEFERVAEGEEYKGGKLNATDLDHGTEKWGKSYGLTFELRLQRRFSDLANFPTFLGNGAVKAENTAVADKLVTTTGFDPDFFGDVKSIALTPKALEDAIKELAMREDHRGDLVDTSNLVLIHGPGLAPVVNQILTADKLVIEETGRKTETPNPFRGLVTGLSSRSLGKALGTKQGGAWALVQGSSSILPSLIKTGLEGHDGNVDIRVERNQGENVGGGQIAVEEGSFRDDTIWYRGRTFFGIDTGFNTGVYASNGTA